MRSRNFPFTLMLGLCLAPFVESAPAQTIAMTYTLTPKAGSGAGFETALKRHMEWRVDNGDPWVWEIYQVATGDDLGAYVARSPGHTWADIDAYEASDFQPAAEAHFGATVGPLMASESSTISVLGGAFGGVCGWAMANFLAEYTQILKVHTSPALVIIALAMALIVGIISGIYPAIRASRLDPVTALRYE